MAAQRLYEKLPFSWQDKPLKRISAECRWLEDIVRNSAPFSQSWTQARIVQLAHPKPPQASSEAASQLPTYAGLSSEQAIVEALRSLCNLQQYPGFRAAITEAFVVETLNRWHRCQFAEAVSCNYEIYADRRYKNVFLVTSTARTTPDANRQLPPVQRFRALFNAAELAWLLRSQETRSLTLRTHSYATAAPQFYRRFRHEADALVHQDLFTDGPTLPATHAYVGYQWPSEVPWVSPALWLDSRRSGAILPRLILILGFLAGIGGTLAYGLLHGLIVPLVSLLEVVPGGTSLLNWLQFEQTVSLSLQWYWLVPTLFVSWLVGLQLVRAFGYQRDRDRALREGSLDLAEFWQHLDAALADPSTWPTAVETESGSQAAIAPIALNFIGHGIGSQAIARSLQLVPPVSVPTGNAAIPAESVMGRYLVCDRMILVAPDIPAYFLQQGRNNPIRHALQRCHQLYLCSSDRDVLLRYVSLVPRWLTDSNSQLAACSLGNVYLARSRTKGQVQRPYPAIRPLFRSQPLAPNAVAYDLLDRINYLDCSALPDLTLLKWPIAAWKVPFTDGINTVLFLLGRLAVHEGYFSVASSSFMVLRSLIATEQRSDIEIQQTLIRLTAETPIQFLPSGAGATPRSQHALEQEISDD